jgi:hypothetical protein
LETVAKRLKKDNGLLRIILISDFLQNSPAFSMYPTVPDLDAFLKSPKGHAVAERFSKNIESVDLLLCQITPHPKQTIQFNKAIHFWLNLLNTVRKRTSKNDEQYACRGFETRFRPTKRELQ